MPFGGVERVVGAELGEEVAILKEAAGAVDILRAVTGGGGVGHAAAGHFPLLVDFRHGGDAMVGGEDDKDAFRTRLLSAANSKLIRLHKMGRAVAERWGSKDKLVDALLLLQRRGKDEDYRSKLSTLPLGKLYDQFHSLERAAKRAKA